MQLQGLDQDNKQKTICFEINAQEGDGLYIPCIPAIFLCEQIALGRQVPFGALPCVGLVSLDNYLELMKRLGLKIGIRQTVSIEVG